jgi:hypothetical protein
VAQGFSELQHKSGPSAIEARHGESMGWRRDSHHRLNCMNRHGLAELNRRDFLDVQLEVVRLYRANGTFKEWLDPDAWISNIAYEGVRT